MVGFPPLGDLTYNSLAYDFVMPVRLVGTSGVDSRPLYAMDENI